MHRLISIAALCALALAAPGAATAQELESMVVTANYAGGDATVAAPPAIYRRIPADFVLVAVNYQSGSLQPAERRGELETMFGRLRAEVGKTPGYTLYGGEAGTSLATIDTVLFTDVFSDYDNRGRFTLTLGINTKPGETFDLLMARAGKFIEGIKVAGRAESFLADEQFLGAKDVTQHRAELVADIAAETAKLQTMFQNASVEITGLENRVITQPSGPLELEIFIPYTLVVESEAND